MKCKVCGGTGTSNTCVNGTFKPCSFCDGTGEYEPFDADVELDKLDNDPMTNEEWLCEYLVQFCRMSTNKKAKRIADLVANFIPRIEEINCNEFAWLRWLKEEHKDA